MIYILLGVVAIILLLMLFQLRKIMSTQAQLAVALTAIAAQIAKIGDETKTLIAKIDELQAALNNAGNNAPEVETALQAVKDQLQIVDDLVPDAQAVVEEHTPTDETDGESTGG